MSWFSYKAINPDGAVVRGVTEAEDLTAAFGEISAKGLSILDVRRATAAVGFLGRVFVKRTLKRKDVIEFAVNLSVMLKAGIPIVTAFEDLLYTIESRNLKGILADLKIKIESGTRLSDAIESRKEEFPLILVRLVRVGEETGRLDKSLAEVAGHLQKMEELTKSIKRALIYPAFAVVAALGSLIFWVAYVLPRLMDAMKGIGIKLPFLTRVIMHVSDFIGGYWYFILLIPAAVIAVGAIMKQNDNSRYYMDMLKMKLPVVKLVVYNKLLALFSEQMRILIMAGIPIDRSLGIVADVMGNEVFKVAALKAKESISEGNSIADSLKAQKEFPQLLIRMAGIGETSGSLETQFGFLSDYYLKKLDDISQKLGKMIEPIVIGVVGVFFAIIIIGLLGPIYDLISRFGKM